MKKIISTLAVAALLLVIVAPALAQTGQQSNMAAPSQQGTTGQPAGITGMSDQMQDRQMLQQMKQQMDQMQQQISQMQQQMQQMQQQISQMQQRMPSTGQMPGMAGTAAPAQMPAR